MDLYDYDRVLSSKSYVLSLLPLAVFDMNSCVPFHC